MSKTERQSINDQLDSALSDIYKLQERNSVVMNKERILTRDERIAEQLTILQGMITKHRGIIASRAWLTNNSQPQQTT